MSERTVLRQSQAAPGQKPSVPPHIGQLPTGSAVTKKIGQKWTRPSLLLAFASLVLHALANGHYGIFRDELYFIVCGDQPDWGYVDQPAVVPLLASWSHTIFGDFLG